MKVKIYQLDFDKYIELCFKEYERIHKLMSDKEILEHCNLVYECERDNNYSPDSAFREFNAYRPTDYTGRSLSVGDIVELDGRAYYCNPTGWTDLNL